MGRSERVTGRSVVSHDEDEGLPVRSNGCQWRLLDVSTRHLAKPSVCIGSFDPRGLPARKEPVQPTLRRKIALQL